MIRVIKKTDFSQVTHINHNMTVDKLDSLMKKYTFLVLVEEGMVKGYVVYQLSGKAFDIQHLFVDPLYRREGIGTSLMYEVLKRMKMTTKTVITISVSDKNLAAHLFLKNMGFFGRIPEDVDGWYDFEFKVKEKADV
jgi:ribosomal protein S18 acetylase RimI-like enzyme